jgi:carboxyl-terminal processing protease
MRLNLLFLLLIAVPSAAQAPSPSGLTPDDYRADARSIEPLIAAQYAYLDRFERGLAPISPRLRAEAEQVTDRQSLLVFAERVLLALADHHAITGASTAHSWAVVPSYADLWIERLSADYVVGAIRDGSPAAAAGIVPGDLLTGVSGVPIAVAVEAFWSDLGLPLTDERASFAARVLAAGRRDSSRQLELRRRSGETRTVELPNLYTVARAAGERRLVVSQRRGGALEIRFNDSLGENGTIAEFDAAMAEARPAERIVIDLTETPSGGNTVVARALMGWFVTRARSYQIHSLPAEERATGVPRQWVEQVLPRAGKSHRGPVMVRVGRWTGSMGEGLAIGFHAIGADVVGTRMAGLRGAVYDHRLGRTGLVLKLPTERLYAVDGTPRENFVPQPPIRVLHHRSPK